MHSITHALLTRHWLPGMCREGHPTFGMLRWVAFPSRRAPWDRLWVVSHRSPRAQNHRLYHSHWLRGACVSANASKSFNAVLFLCKCSLSSRDLRLTLMDPCGLIHTHPWHVSSRNYVLIDNWTRSVLIFLVSGCSSWTNKSVSVSTFKIVWDRF